MGHTSPVSFQVVLLLLPFFAQGIVIVFDEFYFHHKRRLKTWEIFGHPLDSLTVVGVLALTLFTLPTQENLTICILAALASCLFITKDEWVHTRECEATENWLHALLFVFHPLVFASAIVVWINPAGIFTAAQIDFLHTSVAVNWGLIVFFTGYQIIYWPLVSRPPAKVDNSIYQELGERWYEAYDDPVALLRAECLVKGQWIEERIRKVHLATEPRSIKILDVGCGAGFLSNALAQKSFSVTGVDLSPESLKVARKYDSTKTVQYLDGDATLLPFESGQFDVVTALDLLEHVENPEAVIKEAGRVLKPGGLFFFHTFNRNLLSRIVIIRMVELFVKNTPKHMHVAHLFITPAEAEKMAKQSGMTVTEWTGIRPKFSSVTMKGLLTRTVPKSFSFKLTKSLSLSYLGVARLDSEKMMETRG